MKIYVSNEKGFSLVEIIIASALMSIIGLGVMNIIGSGYKASKDLQIRQESKDIRDQIYVAVQGSYCGLAKDLAELSTFSLDEASSKEIAFPNLYLGGSLTLSPGSKLGDFDIASGSAITINPPRPGQTVFEGLAKAPGSAYYKIGNQILGEMKINIQHKNASKIIPLNYMVLVEVDGSNKIISCNSMSDISHAKDACESMSDSSGQISYNWDDSSLKCDVQVAPKPAEISANGGVLNQSDNGSTFMNPNYILK